MRDLRREAPIVFIASAALAGVIAAELLGALGVALALLAYLCSACGSAPRGEWRDLAVLACAASAWLAIPTDSRPAMLGPDTCVVPFHGTLQAARSASQRGRAQTRRLHLAGGREHIALTLRDAAGHPRYDDAAHTITLRGLARYDPPSAMSPARLVTDSCLLRADAPGLLERARRAAQRRIRNALSPLRPRVRAFCLKLLVGAGTLDDRDRDAHRETGLAHRLAISGLHAVFVASIVLTVLRAIIRSASIRFAVLCSCLAIYAWLCGARPPVLRACIAFALWQLARARGRPCSLASLLAIATLACLGIRGEDFSSISLRLSVAAVIGITVLGRSRSATQDPSRRAKRFARLCRSALRVSGAAWLATAAFALDSFGATSPWGIVLTPLAVPGVLFVLSGTILNVALDLLGIPLAGSALGVLDTVAALQLDAVRMLAELPGTPVLALTQASPGTVPCVWAALALTAWLASSRLAFGAGCALAMLPSLVPLSTARTDSGDFLRVLDVGHGQCVLLRARDTTSVIDCGDRVAGQRSARLLVSALHEIGATKIDELVLTHGDDDHLSGVTKLLTKTRIKRAWLPESPKLAQTMRILQRHGCAIRVVTARQLVRVSDGLQVASVLDDADLAPSNEGGLLCVAELGPSTRIVVFGDHETAACRAARRQLAGMRVDALVVPHHGAAPLGLAPLLEELGPAVTLASTSARKPLPDAWRLDRRLRPYRPFTTAAHGDLEVRAGAGGPILRTIRGP